MPPTVQDEQPAVVLDELLFVYAEVSRLVAERQQSQR